MKPHARSPTDVGEYVVLSELDQGKLKVVTMRQEICAGGNGLRSVLVAHHVDDSWNSDQLLTLQTVQASSHETERLVKLSLVMAALVRPAKLDGLAK